MLNPVSGGGNHEARLPKALKYSRRKHDLVEVHRARAIGEASAVARNRCAEGFDAVIAAGGDRTLLEVPGRLMGT